MPKFMTYQRPRPITQAKWGGGSKPPFGPAQPPRKQPKPAPDQPGPVDLPPLSDLLKKPR